VWRRRGGAETKGSSKVPLLLVAVVVEFAVAVADGLKLTMSVAVEEIPPLQNHLLGCGEVGWGIPFPSSALGNVGSPPASSDRPYFGILAVSQEFVVRERWRRSGTLE
jgi:hypothetical protein